MGPLLIQTADKGTPVYIGLQTPFFYNPANGNVLLEVRNYEPTAFPGVPQLNAGPLDAFDVAGDPISRVYALGNADATTGIADTLGLTTFFVVTPIPEPSTLVLLTACLEFFGLRWYRIKRSGARN